MANSHRPLEAVGNILVIEYKGGILESIAGVKEFELSKDHGFLIVTPVLGTRLFIRLKNSDIQKFYYDSSSTSFIRSIRKRREYYE